MIRIDSIANKFRLSYVVFALLLCTTFVSIFMVAETKMEQELVKARLLQQLQLSQEKDGDQPIYTAKPGIIIYRYDKAPIKKPRRLSARFCYSHALLKSSMRRDRLSIALQRVKLNG